MKVNKLVWILISGCILSWSALLFAGFKEGETYYGFKLLEKRFVKEVNAECFYFEHLKSGARLFKIVADDANKTFSIAFKTVPQTDAGTPHILEHAVLNGSKNFPVKSPFDVLSKGSLNTFLNAMTGKEITIYPVASMNDKDFFNLMHVYLDAVFNPLIYDDPRILKQEGWHHELMARDSAVVYKGVVYNEMKGAYSNPSRELAYRIDKHLFPESSYRFSSGGYPPSIPTLTHEDFLDFHRRYYHPSNSYIYLYGDADLEKELAFIDTKYLSHYERLDERAFIPIQEPFEKMREAGTYYAVPEGSDTTDQSYLTLSFVADLSTNQTLYRTFSLTRNQRRFALLYKRPVSEGKCGLLWMIKNKMYFKSQYRMPTLKTGINSAILL
jgi:Zn-dependent M16 (insulinase) family peptidase